MAGYAGKILRVNLSNGEIIREDLTDPIKDKSLGGRGLAVKLLWDEVKGVDPLTEDNKIVFATGPLTGLPLPSSGKMVIATKSPLTGGYGDSNIGSRASVHLKKEIPIFDEKKLKALGQEAFADIKTKQNIFLKLNYPKIPQLCSLIKSAEL
jgi:hypothetical protein